MSSDKELNAICERAFACKSEEEAFEIIQRLRPYFQDTRAETEGDPEKDKIDGDHQ